MNADNINPLLCDPLTGICQLPEEINQDLSGEKHAETIQIIYFTDPICSSCWGIEPQLRRLKLEYGHNIDVDYRMGGLLPDWSYNSGGISKPSDVAHHWDEVSEHYDMPIDGDVWLEDPLHSSYPPSIAFKAAQQQGQQAAVNFLRIAREMVFLQKKNITKWEHLADAATASGLDLERFQDDYEGKAQILFEQDLRMARKLGVRGFPTMFFVDANGDMEKVYGVATYSAYESALKKQLPQLQKKTFQTDWRFLFSKFPTMTSREFSELSGYDRKKTETFLQGLAQEGSLKKMPSKNGPLWLYR